MDGVIGIIFNDKGQVLLQKRRDIPVWSLPGGGINKSESPEKAVVREVYEETGIKSKVIRQIAEYSFKSGKKNYFFECKQIGGNLQTSNESSKVDFFSTEKLPKPYDPLVPQLINDALKQQKTIIKKQLKTLTFKNMIYYFVAHPLVAFKYVLKLKKAKEVSKAP